MKTLERMEALLDEKDAEIEQLSGRVAELEEEAERNRLWTEHRRFDEDVSPTLPVPRLEIRWRELEPGERDDGYEIQAEYSLVYRHFLGHIVFVPLGFTRSTGALSARTKWGDIELPFRDGAHFYNEMKQLGLRGFAICGDRVDEMKFCRHCERRKEAHDARGGDAACPNGFAS